MSSVFRSEALLHHAAGATHDVPLRQVSRRLLVLLWAAALFLVAALTSVVVVAARLLAETGQSR